jgi:methylmalonyl-CoA mutase C-terminal domain/subunit
MSPKGKPIKVLLTRSQLDCHQRGLITIAAALRDAGMEVIYTRFLMPEEVVKTAVEEDVDVIGLSFMAWSHLGIMEEVMSGLKARKMDNVLVIVGGIMREDHVPKLKELGVGGIFFPGTNTQDVVAFLKERKG